MSKGSTSFDWSQSKKYWDICDKENPTEEECIEAVTHNPFILGKLNPKYQTEKICIAAVKECGYVIKYVVNQTVDIRCWAVRECYDALQFIEPEDQTFYICYNSILYHPSSLQYVKDQNPGMCLYAINRDPDSIQYVNIPYTFDMIWLAFRKKPSTLKYVFRRWKNKKQNKNTSKMNPNDYTIGQGSRSHMHYNDESTFKP